VTTVIGYAGSNAEFTTLAEAVKSKLQEYNRLYDIYNNYDGINNIKTINDNAGIRAVKVDPRIIELLLLSKKKCELTDGAVNIAMGSVLAIWHTYREAGIDDPEHASLPPMDRLIEASKHTDIDNVIIDLERSAVFLSDPKMRLDVGAVAKGYAAEQTALYFEGKGVRRLLLSVGGNVRAVGHKLEQNNHEVPWVVGIQNPDKLSRQTELLSVNCSGRALVTSGVYERYYTVGGKQYHHIINPQTLMPADYYKSVSILCPDSGFADGFTTAIFNMPLEKGRAFIEALKDTEALWVLSDGTIAKSSGFDAYVVK